MKYKRNVSDNQQRFTVHLEAWIGCDTKTDPYDLIRRLRQTNFEVDVTNDYEMLLSTGGRWHVDHVEVSLDAIEAHHTKRIRHIRRNN